MTSDTYCEEYNLSLSQCVLPVYTYLAGQYTEDPLLYIHDRIVLSLVPVDLLHGYIVTEGESENEICVFLL